MALGLTGRSHFGKFMVAELGDVLLVRVRFTAKAGGAQAVLVEGDYVDSVVRSAAGSFLITLTSGCAALDGMAGIKVGAAPETTVRTAQVGTCDPAAGTVRVFTCGSAGTAVDPGADCDVVAYLYLKASPINRTRTALPVT